MGGVLDRKSSQLKHYFKNCKPNSKLRDFDPGWLEEKRHILMKKCRISKIKVGLTVS